MEVAVLTSTFFTANKVRLEGQEMKVFMGADHLTRVVRATHRIRLFRIVPVGLAAAQAGIL